MTTTPENDYADLRARLARSPFRSRFHLKRADRAYLAAHPRPVIEAQAARILAERLAPAFPVRDGRQTPMRGHPVFIAQHALGICCRGCLAKWHGIPKGRPLAPEELARLTGYILAYLADEAGDLSEFGVTPDLFQ